MASISSRVRTALLGLLAAVGAASAAPAYLARTPAAILAASPVGHRSPTSATSAIFASTSADIPNPDRGFYVWAGSDFVASFDPGSVQAAYAAGLRLVQAEVSLGDYRDRDLPASFLSALGANFAAVRSAGMKVSLLFAYDFTAAGNDTSAAQITRHLQQLNAVLAANADVIPYMRAGFIGAWGEWHSSQSGNSCGYHSGDTSCATADANRATVRDALFANVPATTQIGFRYPADLQHWYPNADGPARVGSNNDCFLAGPSDSGTYADPSQRLYIMSLTAHAAFGGETCENAETPVRDTCADILAEGAQYHLAWLNSLYATSMLDAWKRGGCYSTVSATMGYRIQLDRVKHATSASRGKKLVLRIDLRNVGWARMFVARSLVVTLRNRETGATIAASGGDLGALPAQATASTRLLLHVRIPAGATTGAYDVSLSAPDVFAALEGDPRFAVRFANADQPGAGQTWSASTATLSTGTSVQVN